MVRHVFIIDSREKKKHSSSDFIYVTIHFKHKSQKIHEFEVQAEIAALPIANSYDKMPVPRWWRF